MHLSNRNRVPYGLYARGLAAERVRVRIIFSRTFRPPPKKHTTYYRTNIYEYLELTVNDHTVIPPLRLKIEHILFRISSDSYSQLIQHVIVYFTNYGARRWFITTSICSIRDRLFTVVNHGRRHCGCGTDTYDYIIDIIYRIIHIIALV